MSYTYSCLHKDIHHSYKSDSHKLDNHMHRLRLRIHLHNRNQDMCIHSRDTNSTADSHIHIRSHCQTCHKPTQPMRFPLIHSTDIHCIESKPVGTVTAPLPKPRIAKNCEWRLFVDATYLLKYFSCLIPLKFS